MSILIKGMEMPTSCARCRCSRGCQAVNDRIARMDDQPWFPSDHRHNDCPLVPVPPHGRLIDADALVIDNGIKEIPEYYEVVCDAPTIIPADKEGK